MRWIMPCSTARALSVVALMACAPLLAQDPARESGSAVAADEQITSDVDADSADAEPIDPYADTAPLAEQNPSQTTESDESIDDATSVVPDADLPSVTSDDSDPADEQATPAALDPATLDGIHPGSTTRSQLREKWGDPVQSQRVAGGSRETYQRDKLGPVRVAIFEDVVTSLTVHIERPAPLESVAQRLAIDDVESVAIYDERGEMLGAAYPERGVLLGFVPQADPPRVFQVVIEEIEAQPFIARAEARLPNRWTESLSDVEQALALSPDHPQALALRGQLLLRAGRLDEALKSAQRAADREPRIATHRLLVAQILAAAGDYPQAIARVRDLLEEPNLSDLDAARAACQWGDYLAHSHVRDFAGAIKYHQQAIQLAEPLAADPEQSTRRAAKRLLLEAHLGIAHDIGHGRWQQKTDSVAKWIDRAAVLADDLMRKEQAGAEVRLRVYFGALAAISGIAQPPDVSKWVANTRALGQRLYEASQDPVHRAELAWQLAAAMSEAVEIEIARGRPDEAFAAGSLARSLFEAAEPVAASLPTYDYQRGRLLYRMGATYAVSRGDHAQAVVWFDRAAPLLESPVPAAGVDAGVHGETFVSMAVSYWEQQNRDEALRLTNQGLKLMEQAVEDGTLEAASLAVPYGNLSAMHEELGDTEQAKWCADLANRYETAKK